MGTSIELTVGPVSLSYSKNFVGINFGYLFQEGDLARRQSDQISYEYFEEHPDDEEVAGNEEGFVRPLSRVVPRLQICGHSLANARAEYDVVIGSETELIDEGDEAGSRFLSFEEFRELACLFPLSTLSTAYIDYDTNDRDRLSQGRFAAHLSQFDRLPLRDNHDMYWSEASFLSARLCVLSAESMLQIFASNRDNHDAEVMWQFGPIVRSGWVDRESFKAGAIRTQAILVATEGASDARILRRALDTLRPDVADFFRFIDGDERHHFWGSGNLVRFGEGLLRIDIQNQVLFLLDNDAEGVDAYRKLLELKLPSNMRCMVLPDLDELRDFPALGPEGLHNCDINGRAAAIECYLDLNLAPFPPARVIWSNYKKDVEAWHGALEHKESYTKHFIAQDADAIAGGPYDASKLGKLLDALVREASGLSGLLDSRSPSAD